MIHIHVAWKNLLGSYSLRANIFIFQLPTKNWLGKEVKATMLTGTATAALVLSNHLPCKLSHM
jgi:hypothetical protein